MKKKSIINLIKYHTEKNEIGFRQEVNEIALEFDSNGDSVLAHYIMSLVATPENFIPNLNDDYSTFFIKENINNNSLKLPEVIFNDFMGVVNAIGHNVGINKFLFRGAPGTGKTEACKQLARILKRDLFSVNFSTVIDSKLGQTQKNITSLFNELKKYKYPENIIVLFDEIDAIALDRTNNNDIREMGRATSTLLKEFDNLDDRIVLVATTNLFKYFDKALIRRFDAIIDFDRYTKEDLVEISESYLNQFLLKFKYAGKNIRLFKKIINLMNPILSPGELKNIIKTSLAFSNNNEFDYLKKLYNSICSNHTNDLKALESQGFTLKEIEILNTVEKDSTIKDMMLINNN